MQLSSQGVDLIMHFEGCKLKAYKDIAGILTIGYGHTGSDVEDGQEITQEQANALLDKDLQKFVDGVNDLLTVDVTQGQFDALVCFAYNVGLNALSGSTLLKLVNSNDFGNAVNQFIRWNRAGGQVSAGLTARREAEANLFSS